MMVDLNSREKGFVQKLTDYALNRKRDDSDGSQARSALAALRRGLGKRPGEAPEMFRYIVPHLREKPTFQEEETYYLVAALFAWHAARLPPDDATPPGNLGATFALHAEQMPKLRDEIPQSVEKRFTTLLNCGWDTLPDHLRHAIGLLADDPIDWELLFRDVRDWEAPNRQVQRRWARAFYRADIAKVMTVANKRAQDDRDRATGEDMDASTEGDKGDDNDAT